MTQLAPNYTGASVIEPSMSCAGGSFVSSMIPMVNDDAYQKNLDDIYTSIKRSDLARSVEQLEGLKKLSANWDGYNADVPNLQAIEKANVLLNRLFILRMSYPLRNDLNLPNVTADSDGNVVLEWWVETRKLTLYVSSDEITYIKVEGEEIECIEDGTFVLEKLDVKIFSTLFGWLAG